MQILFRINWQPATLLCTNYTHGLSENDRWAASKKSIFSIKSGEQGLFSAMVVLEVGIIFKQTILDMRVLKNDLRQEPFSIKGVKTEKQSINMSLFNISVFWISGTFSLETQFVGKVIFFQWHFSIIFSIYIFFISNHFSLLYSALSKSLLYLHQ